ncbi:hypothetical protein P154DRAFT_521771 [Amniculicola lignicola CBS 123094]|uniref:VOC domain-containing protein n=1 Tax=Amniculicola lignicola CBS 123094 TaxID=1392246 RepID=A0A6A5WIW0_9PLEO|nr:hypothetical protein P154DRAFT_521771 [Amniculicola lignicola CBS 123094]
MRAFYADALKPLGYSELIPVPGGQLYGFGSDYPYLWLQALPEGQTANPIHVAIDAPNNEAVDEFHSTGLKMGGTDNGKPGIRERMSRQPYYAAFVIDPEGNNLEAVCVQK